MKTTAGAIIILAGAIMFGLSEIALAISRHSSQGPEGEAAFGMFAGAALGIAGIVILGLGFLRDGKS